MWHKHPRGASLGVLPAPALAMGRAVRFPRVGGKGEGRVADGWMDKMAQESFFFFSSC